jgi:hypothetical protein
MVSCSAGLASAREGCELSLRAVNNLMEGKGIESPSTVAAVDETFKKVPESRKKQGHQITWGLKLRHDVPGENGKPRRGWKGLGLVQRAAMENVEITSCGSAA